MLRTRIIPSLLLRGTGLVKTTQFKNPKYVGDPINVVKIFNTKEVDELFIVDIEATKTGSQPNFGLLERIVSEAFMPVGYGGGIQTVEQARTLLQLGVEKVIINTAALNGVGIVTELASKFGNQCVVGIVDVKRTWTGTYRVHSYTGRSVREEDPVRWAQELAKAGAGEIFVQSVDRDGTLKGLDLELMRRFDGNINVPLVAGGGAASVDQMEEALRTCHLSGLAVGARFVYHGPHRAVLVSYLNLEELARLQRAGGRM